MKKHLFNTLLSVSLLTAGLGSLSLAAAENAPAPAILAQDGDKDIPAAMMNEAKAYYIENAVIGFKVGFKLGGMPLPEEKTAAFKMAVTNWLEQEFLPFMAANGILKEWVEMQFSPEVKDFNKRCANAGSMDDFMKIAQETEAYTKEHYPRSYSVLKSPDCRDVMLKLQNAMIRIMTE